MLLLSPALCTVTGVLQNSPLCCWTYPPLQSELLSYSWYCINSGQVSGIRLNLLLASAWKTWSSLFLLSWGGRLTLFIYIQRKRVLSRSIFKNYVVKNSTKQTWQVLKPNNDISSTDNQAEMKSAALHPAYAQTFQELTWIPQLWSLGRGAGGNSCCRPSSSCQGLNSSHCLRRLSVLVLVIGPVLSASSGVKALRRPDTAGWACDSRSSGHLLARFPDQLKEAFSQDSKEHRPPLSPRPWVQPLCTPAFSL